MDFLSITVKNRMCHILTTSNEVLKIQLLLQNNFFFGYINLAVVLENKNLKKK